ncbi:MAG: MBL fold metallo-hydrolase [Spirochaetes bacterium]|nr:MBL fold metallo-hydrolase [Spirochaetota bacterium]
MKVTVLVENTSGRPDLRAEHGLSFCIEASGRKILLDTGQKDLFIENAAKLGCDLASVDYVILSHGHGDHSGGLPAFRAINPKALVYMARSATERRYVRKFGIFQINVGMPREFVSDSGIVFLDGDLHLPGDIHILTPLTNDKPYLTAGGNLTMRRGLRFVRDDFSHELVFVAREGERTLVISSCSHTGLHNIMGRVDAAGLLGEATTVLAGMHLFDPVGGRTERSEILDRFACDLLAFRNVTYYAGHCTGRKAFERLALTMGDRIRPMQCGDVLEV